MSERRQPRIVSDRHFSVPAPRGRAMLDSFGGEDEWIIATDRGDVRFCWSDRFGPFAVTASGAVRDLSHRHPFWRAASLWNLQGRRVEDGSAIWHEPKQPVLARVGKLLVIVEHGDPGWDW